MDVDVAREGFTVLHKPQTVLLDIIFVHGIQGHPLHTWASDRPAQTDASGSSGMSLLKDEYDPIEEVMIAVPPRAVSRPNSKRARIRRLFGMSAAPESTSKLLAPATSSAKHAQHLCRTRPTYWPYDLLAKEESCQNARILTYGYDSVVIKGYQSTNRNNFFSHAKDLLHSLGRERPHMRPIIFVAHSMGGLLVKEVLRRSEASDEHDIQDIVHSARGVIFLGTPHRGSPELADLGQTVGYLASAIARVDYNPTLLRALGSDSPELELGRESFLTLWRKYGFRVKTFQEGYALTGMGLPILNQKIVPAISSTLDDPREHAETISANHMDMCRFSADSDPGYRKVAGELRVMSEMIVADPRVTPGGERILASLYFPEMENRESNVHDALERTCDWVYEQRTFIDWLSRADTARHHGLLWVKGKPGAGKSTLMKDLVRRAKEKSDHGTDIVMSFFFNARGTHVLEKSMRGLYQSLLYQSLRRNPRALEHIVRARNQALQSSTIQWSFRELKWGLRNAFTSEGTQPTYLFIDAMDECADDEVRDLVHFLQEITALAFTNNVNLNICISSRHYPQISIDGCPEIIVEGNNRNDILRYIEVHAGTNEDLQQLKPDIINRADGVFLWVVLVLVMLKKVHRGRSLMLLRQRLDTIPPDLELLFTDLFSTVDESEVDQTVALIDLMLFAQYPLQLSQIHLALSFAVKDFTSIQMWKDSPYYLDSTKKRREQIIELSRGVLEPTSTLPSDPTYQFIHETVREFFLGGEGYRLLGRSRENVMGHGHSNITLACTRYLDVGRPKNLNRLGGFKYNPWSSPEHKLDFYDYAKEHGLFHLNMAELAGLDETTALISFEKTNSSARLLRGTMMYYAAEHGYHGILTRLCSMGVDVNTLNVELSYRSPLLVAVANEHKESIEVLLKNGADHLQTDIYGRRCLNILAEQGDAESDTFKLFAHLHCSRSDKSKNRVVDLFEGDEFSESHTSFRQLLQDAIMEQMELNYSRSTCYVIEE